MDLIHEILNIILPLTVFPFLLVFLPPYLLFELLTSIKRRLSPENVAGKSILITGASSGIGESLAYEYGKRRARLALVDIREDRLRAVAEKARRLGSPDVLVIWADVSKVEDCERFVRETVNRFGKYDVFDVAVDLLVNNAGVIDIRTFAEYNLISGGEKVLNTNLWGSVYGTHFAIPHLRRSKGRIIAISSIAAWTCQPKLSFYNASKAALTSFYETLRVEFGSEIGITIVTPGLIDSQMVQPFVSEMRGPGIPAMSTEGCARSIVDSACRGDKYLTVPCWFRMVFVLKILCPQLMEWVTRAASNGEKSTSKKRE